MARRVRRCGGTTDERVVRRTGGDSIPVWERKEGISGQVNGVSTAGLRGWRRRDTTHPKRLRNPNVSMTMPVNGHFAKTSTIPPRKQTVPRSFCLRAKK